MWLGEEKFCGYMELMTACHSVATTQISALEMGCLRKIQGVSRLQKLRNEEIRSSLNQEEMLCK